MLYLYTLILALVVLWAYPKAWLGEVLLVLGLAGLCFTTPLGLCLVVLAWLLLA